MPSADSVERIDRNKREKKRNEILIAIGKLPPETQKGLAGLHKFNQSEQKRLRQAAGRRLETKRVAQPRKEPYDQQDYGRAVRDIGSGVSKAASTAGSVISKGWQGAGRFLFDNKDEGPKSERMGPGKARNERAMEIIASQQSLEKKVAAMRRLGYRADTAREMIRNRS